MKSGFHGSNGLNPKVFSQNVPDICNVTYVIQSRDIGPP